MGVEMNKTFTASEVREKEDIQRTAARLCQAASDDSGARMWDQSADMLHAFADRLEADEKAVPVAYAEFTDGGCIRMWSRQYEERLPGTRMIPLYTHPGPADAERLAEALRDLVRVCEEHDKTISRIIGHPAGWNDLYLTAGRDALAAHSAQAQPPARTCSDERPCVNCYSGQGECLGPAPETVRQRKEQRAVEIASAISTRSEFSRYEAPLILDIVKAALAAQEG